MSCCEYKCNDCDSEWLANSCPRCPECRSNNIRVIGFDDYDHPITTDEPEDEEDEST